MFMRVVEFSLDWDIASSHSQKFKPFWNIQQTIPQMEIQYKLERMSK